MNDSTTTIKTLKERMHQFVEKRDWGQFHSPKNLSMALAAEAAELMEFFMWTKTEESKTVFEDRREEIENEIADVAAYLFSLCAQYDIDLTQVFERKMELNALKYPVEKAKGKWTKYSDL